MDKCHALLTEETSSNNKTHHTTKTQKQNAQHVQEDNLKFVTFGFTIREFYQSFQSCWLCITDNHKNFQHLAMLTLNDFLCEIYFYHDLTT